jgi:hypothetical protein
VSGLCLTELIRSRAAVCILNVCYCCCHCSATAATVQFIFDYYVIIRKLFKASNNIYNTDVGSSYNFIQYTFRDRHNLGILAAVWVGTLPILFVDTTIFYVIGANIFAVIGGLWRRVGEVSAQLLTIFVTIFGSCCDEYLLVFGASQRYLTAIVSSVC